MHADADDPSLDSLLQHADFLRGIAKGLLRSPDEAEDAVQETWLKALESPPRHTSNLRGWLAAITRNRALLKIRSKKRAKTREAAAAQAEGLDPTADVAARAETHTQVAAAVRDLDEPYKSTVVYRYFDGLKPREIAKRQQVPVDTVHTRLRRAHEKLRQQLDAAHGGNRKAWVTVLVPLLLAERASAGAIVGAILLSTRAKSALILLLLVFGFFAIRAVARTDPHRADRAPRIDVPEASAQKGAAQKELEERDAGASAANPAARQGARSYVRVTFRNKPVADAWVQYVRANSRQVIQATSNVDGLVGIEASGAVSITAWHARHGPARVQLGSLEPGEIFSIELPGGHEATVVVKNSAGHAVAGARVILLHAGGGKLSGINQGADEEFTGPKALRALPAMQTDDLMMSRDNPLLNHDVVLTDATGRAVFTGLPQGTLDAVVMHDDYVARRAKGRIQTRIEVTLSPGGALRVIARGRAGQLCEVIRPGPMPVPIGLGELNGDGIIEFRALPAGPCTVVVSPHGTTGFGGHMGSEGPDGDPKQVKGPTTALTRPIKLVNEKQTVVDFSEATGTHLHGTVTAAGKPQVDTKVWLYRAGEQIRKVAEIRTTGAGEYSFDGLEPGTYLLRAELKKNAILRARLTLTGGALRHDLHAPPSGCSGTIFDPSGKPAVKARVVLALILDQPSPIIEGGGEPAIVEMLAGKTSTDADGHYSIDGVAPGRYMLLAGAGNRTVQRPVTIKNTDERIDIRMAGLPGHKLTIRYVGPGGEPLDALALVRDAHGGYAPIYALAMSVKMTSQVSHVLPPGRYRLTAFTKGFAPIDAETVDLNRDSTVTLRFERGVQVTLELRRKGAAADSATVTLTRPDGVRLGPGSAFFTFIQSARLWRAPPDGVLTLPAIPRGTYTIAVNGKPAGKITVGTQPLHRVIEID